MASESLKFPPRPDLPGLWIYPWGPYALDFFHLSYNVSHKFQYIVIHYMLT